LHDCHGFSFEQIENIAKLGIDYSFLSEKKRTFQIKTPSKVNISQFLSSAISVHRFPRGAHVWDHVVVITDGAFEDYALIGI